ncbi:pilus assembly protein CpaB [Photobacterium sanctipauli]|uniref:Pilus assembly protein CpaB n=1 Tax=Photobacterium sanctipauli TaxID=1342794 RepID=A0A2T3NPZ0_9GAMM|nr:RcpC/CpaB family pilus assembly protein [Photobacterium sanctipauli]PSW18345.1 pilus assembly protein CpaB [Photobacterium sanctipauli]
MNSRLIFFVAFFAILTGIYGLVDTFILANEPTPPTLEPVASVTENTITAWRANTALKRGAQLDKTTVSRVQLSQQEANSLGVTSEVELKFDTTTLLNRDIAAGEWVFPHDQTSAGETGYFDLITTEGMMLYPLTVANRNLIKHYIQPGDFIDLLAISSSEVNLTNKDVELDDFTGIKAHLLLRQVKVIALSDAKQSSVQAKVNYDNENQSTIVIEIEPEHIATLSLAQRTLYIEAYPSHDYPQPPEAMVQDIIDNYIGVKELRGNENQQQLEALF